MLDRHCLNSNGSQTFAIGVDGLLIAKGIAKCGVGGREVCQRTTSNMGSGFVLIQ